MQAVALIAQSSTHEGRQKSAGKPDKEHEGDIFYET